MLKLRRHFNSLLALTMISAITVLLGSSATIGNPSQITFCNAEAVHIGIDPTIVPNPSLVWNGMLGGFVWTLNYTLHWDCTDGQVSKCGVCLWVHGNRVGVFPVPPGVSAWTSITAPSCADGNSQDYVSVYQPLAPNATYFVELHWKADTANCNNDDDIDHYFPIREFLIETGEAP